MSDTQKIPPKHTTYGNYKRADYFEWKATEWESKYKILRKGLIKLRDSDIEARDFINDLLAETE